MLGSEWEGIVACWEGIVEMNFTLLNLSQATDGVWA